MSRRRNDIYDDFRFQSNRFFFSDDGWFYRVRTYDESEKVEGPFKSKPLAEAHCNDKYILGHIDFSFY